MEPISVAFFVTGATQLAKKLGVRGDWLVLSAVIAGGLYAYLTTYQPALFSALSSVLVAAAASGNVSLAKDLAQTMGGPPGE